MTLARTFWIQCDKDFPVNKLQGNLCSPPVCHPPLWSTLFSVLTLGSSMLESHVLGKRGCCGNTQNGQREGRGSQAAATGSDKTETWTEMGKPGKSLLAPRTALWVGRAENLSTISAVKWQHCSCQSDKNFLKIEPDYRRALCHHNLVGISTFRWRWICGY